MLSAEDIAIVQTAIEICNIPELKREILCAPGSDYDINKGYGFVCKKQWNEILAKKATKHLGIAKQLQEKVMGIVYLVGMRMLTWAEYHEGTLGFSREYSVNFLNSSFFTQQGTIDNKKAAEELMKDGSLNIEQKFKLGCLYCFTDHFPALYRRMTKEEFYDAEEPQRIKQPELVKCWSYYLMGEIDKLKGEKSLVQYRLERAVESGSIAAVEYCLEKTKLRRRKCAVVDAALEAVRCRARAGPYTGKDWVVFRDQRFKDSVESWVPSDYYVDILSFLLSKMGEDQQIEFLKQDVKGAKYERESFRDQKRSRVLEYFLNWPYQDRFMKTAGLMWEFLPEKDYAALLLRICDEIMPGDEKSLRYGQEKSYDYRGLLKEFWCQSPDRYKRYVLSNQEETCKLVTCDEIMPGDEESLRYGQEKSCESVRYGQEKSCDNRGLLQEFQCQSPESFKRYALSNQEVTWKTLGIKSSVWLLIKLLTLENFTDEDGENIKLILASATGKEKENIFSSLAWKEVCSRQMRIEEWKMLDRFVLNCFLSQEEEDKFKRDFSCTKEAQRVCIDFVKNAKWKAVESFIKWSSLAEEEMNRLKTEMIYSENGKDACVDLISPDKKLEAVDKFIKWFVSEEKVAAFKKELVFSHAGIFKCVDLVTADQLELVDEFISFCLPSEEEVRALKKNVAYTAGSPVCAALILDCEQEDIYEGHDVVDTRIRFKGSKWEEVEKFLTWCFSSEEEIQDFKKDVLLKKFGKEIHFKLIESNQWEEAERFFAWLGLSAGEIRELKKETLFHYDEANEMLRNMMYSEEGDRRFADYGNREEAFELLLRWYLTDRETVLEFKEEFKLKYLAGGYEIFKEFQEEFDFMIEQRLRDLDEEKIGVKRKSETFFPNKRLCNLKTVNIGAEYGK